MIRDLKDKDKDKDKKRSLEARADAFSRLKKYSIMIHDQPVKSMMFHETFREKKERKRVDSRKDLTAIVTELVLYRYRNSNLFYDEIVQQ